MHYRSVMVLGSCHRRRGQAARRCSTISEHLVPGRWAEVRPPSRKELAATLVLALPLDEWSVKVSAGPPTHFARGRGRCLGRRRAASRAWRPDRLLPT